MTLDREIPRSAPISLFLRAVVSLISIRSRVLRQTEKLT